MGFKFDEKTLVNNNIFKYEDKLNSSYTRFLDKTPTYVTYYNINTIESTVDLGFSNVEKILGSNSPIRYSEVKNLPVYGMEAIQINVDEAEEGLTGSYDNGELIILPDTIKPYPDDFFILEHKGMDFLFRVTSVDYDTIKSNNFYKITFTIKYVTAEESKKILDQVTNKFTCVVDNIGTEDKCIIEDEYYELLMRLKDIYREISERYKLFFYKKKYNAFVFIDPEGQLAVYDRYVNMFIQKHGLLYDNESHRTIYLNNEDDDCSFLLEYDMSIYRAYEKRNAKRIPVTKFNVIDINNMYSVFKYYRANKVKSVRFKNGVKDYLPKSLVERMASGELPEITNRGGEVITNVIDPTYSLNPNGTFDEADNIIIKYMHDKIDSIYNIDFDMLDEFAYFYPSWTNLIKVPMLLYALKGYYKLFIKKQSIN